MCEFFKMNIVLFVILFFLIGCNHGLLRCGIINNQPTPEYCLSQPCTKSGANILQISNLQSLELCKKLAHRLSALAFNFINSDYEGSENQRCILYECPELNVTSILIHNTTYDYYSLYSRILPKENITCVPRSGLYLLSKIKANYTEAISKCEEFGGILASVIAESQTKIIADLISKSSINETKYLTNVYVGLDDLEQEGTFISSKGEPLNCISYRSWAPGEPRNKYSNEDCVVIDSDRYWRVVNCNTRLSFMCEILPGGEIYLPSKYCEKLNDKDDKKQCEIENRVEEMEQMCEVKNKELDIDTYDDYYNQEDTYEYDN